jgi:hypothetical protein
MAGTGSREGDEATRIELTYSTTGGISRAKRALGTVMVCIIQVILYTIPALSKAGSRKAIHAAAQPFGFFTSFPGTVEETKPEFPFWTPGSCSVYTQPPSFDPASCVFEALRKPPEDRSGIG